MEKAPAITCAFIDIGSVMATDGWDRQDSNRAAKHFQIDLAEMEKRHHLIWGNHQTGKFTSDEYLDLAAFFQKRAFSRAQFRRFMFAQTKHYPDMIELVTQLKLKHGPKIVVVSDEGRELNAYRVGNSNWIGL